MNDPASSPDALLAHTEFVRALARRLLRDEHGAEDVTQQTMLAALESPPRDHTKWRPWLSRVTRNFAFRSRRDATRRRRWETAGAKPIDIPSPQDIRDREAARRDVVEAVLQLAEPYRTTIILRYLEELPPRDVARRMNAPVETVRTRTRRAVEQLRNTLEQEPTRDWRAGLALLATPKAWGAIAMSAKSKWIGAAVGALLLALIPVWMAYRHQPGSGDRAERTTAERATPLDTSTTAPPTSTSASTDVATGIEGVVRGPSGPIADAFVVLVDGGDKVARRRTTATGRFAFKQTGTFDVIAAHPDYQPGAATVTAEGKSATRVDLVLKASDPIAFRVTDGSTKRVLDDVEVLVIVSGDATNAALETLLAEGGLWKLIPRLSVYDSLMDAFAGLRGSGVVYIPPIKTSNGVAHLRGLLPRGRFQAIVSRHGYAPLLVTRDAIGDQLDVTLQPQSTLRVTAPNIDGQPAVGAWCEVNRPGLFLPMPVNRAQFDENGRVEFGELSAGLYEVIVSRDGTWALGAKAPNADSQGRVSVGRNATAILAQRRVELAPNQTHTVHFGGPETGRIVGTIAAGDGGAMINKVWQVRLRRDDNDVATTNAKDGKFVFESVAPGSYRVVATALASGASVTTDVAVRAGSGDTVVSLRAESGGVRGSVRGRNGQPLPGARMLILRYDVARTLARQDPRGTNEVLSLLSRGFESDRNGRFERPMTAGHYVVFAANDGSADFREVHIKANAQTEVALDLSPARVFPVALELVDRDKPVAGHIFLRGYLGGFVLAFLLDEDAMAPDAKPITARRYRLPKGRYLLNVMAPGRAPILQLPIHTTGAYSLRIPVARGVSATLTLTENDAPLRHVDLALQTALGTTVHRAGHPAALFARSHGWRTDNAGTLVIPCLLPGRYVLLRQDRKIASFRVTDEPLTTRIALAAPPR